MKYKFKENQLNTSFANESTSQAKKFINSSTSFCVVGMPAMGLSIFLRSILKLPNVEFIHINIYSLSELNKRGLFEALLLEMNPKAKLPKENKDLIEEIKKLLKSKTDKHSKIVIIFNRFDQLKSIFTDDLFNDLRSIRSINPESISYIFSANKPLNELIEPIGTDHLALLSESVYLKPYNFNDLQELLKINNYKNLNQKLVQRAIELSGGHFQLLQLLLKSERMISPLNDSFIKLQLKAIIDNLSYSQRKMLQKIALNKPILNIDPYLINLGIVIKTNDNMKLFSPLLDQYIKANILVKLPAKEAKLFKLLKQNLGEVVSLDLIYDHLWGDTEEGSDWALKSLIYRLRRNQTFLQSGYIIESHKKLGYYLQKN